MCLDPLDLEDRDGQPRLVPLTTGGECRVYVEIKTGVTIWTTAGWRERIATLKVPSDAYESA